MRVNRNILIVVAHPDDELLLAGGLISKQQSEKSCQISVCTLASNAGARSTGSGPEKIAKKQKEVFNILNLKAYNYGGQDSNLTIENHLKMVQFIESVIVQEYPSLIITHSPYDTHKDHQIVSQLVSEAFRYFQRPSGLLSGIKELWWGEVPSSTDWSVSAQFCPNVWIPLEAQDLYRKIEGLATYDKVLRPSPHPRSRKNLEALATFRGGQCGSTYAEAFQQVFRIV